MNFELLLGRKLKDDVIVEVLEAQGMEVVYDFDRTNENLADVYWAAAEASGFQFRFDQDQMLDVVFLYIAASEGFSPVARDEVDIPLYENLERAKQDFIQKGISYTESESGNWWIKGHVEAGTRHYEFRDGALSLVTLSGKAG
jgi:hypothetical protein